MFQRSTTCIAVLAFITLPGLSLATNLVNNGGFETGNFNGWTMSGDTSGMSVDGVLPDSGSYAADLGSSPTDGFLTQALPTVAGQQYLLSYWLQDEGGIPSTFSAAWNGNTILGSVVTNNVTGFEYTEYLFSVAATSSSTPLVFTSEQTPAYFHLDNVSVVATPEPASFITCLSVLAGLALIRRRRTSLALSAALGVGALAAQGPSAYTHTMMSDGNWLVIGASSGAGQTLAAIVDSRTRQIKPVGTLMQSRAWHTATTLPDGTVLIAGGIDPNGRVLAAPEIFDPSRQNFQSLPASGMTARAHHSAILLTDGMVLLAGGVAEDGTPLKWADIWDFRTRTARKLASEMLAPRNRPLTKLMPDGSVLLSGGLAEGDRNSVKEEIYAPWHKNFQAWYSGPQEPAGPVIEGSSPEDQMMRIPVDTVIGLRFSRLVAIDSSSTSAILLSDGLQNLAIRIVPAEEGKLLFVIPKAPLASSTLYRLVVNGIKDERGGAVPYSIRAFTTDETTGISNSLAKGVQSLTAMIVKPLAVNPAMSTSIKGFLGCMNGIPPKNIGDTVACIPAAGACSFTVTMSSESLQPACSIAGVKFPRVILDCPGPAADQKFRPSYLLCPTSDQRNHVEVGEDGQKITFTLDRDDTKNKPGMIMGDILVDPAGGYKALTEDDVSIFGKDLDTPKNTCQSSCHYTVKNNGANERAWFLPINPVGTIRGGGTNLAPFVVFTNIDANVYPGTNGVPAANKQKQKFTDVCTAILNADNQKKVIKENAAITAATLNLMGTMCQSLVAKVK